MIYQQINTLILKNLIFSNQQFTKKKMAQIGNQQFEGQDGFIKSFDKNGENGYQKEIIDQMKGMQLDKDVS